MEYKIKALSIYEYGQRVDKEGHPHQEDWLYPEQGNINNDKDRMFILCDGMGGHEAGEIASSTVICWTNVILRLMKQKKWELP